MYVTDNRKDYARKIECNHVKLVRFGNKTVQSSQALAGKTVAWSYPRLVTLWGHASRELGPPSPAQWGEIRRGFSGIVESAVTGRFLDTTVKEGVRNALVFGEICCWFIVGEMIGRRSIIGYKVGESPRALHEKKH